jgi:hypothetical protein
LRSRTVDILWSLPPGRCGGAARARKRTDGRDVGGSSVGITNIILMKNSSNFRVDVRNWETPSDSTSIPRHGTVGDIAMWIPWCNTENDFVHGHRITVNWTEPAVTNGIGTSIEFSYSIFQSGNSVRLLEGSYWSTSDVPIYGDPSIDGERILQISQTPGATSPSPSLRISLHRFPP